MRVQRGLLLVVIFALIAIVGSQTPLATIRAQGSIPQISYGQTVNGQINKTETGWRAVYLFSGNEGDVIAVTMTRTSGDLIPLIGLGTVDQNGNTQPLTSSQQSTGDTATIKDYRLLFTSTYYILATREGVGQGTTQGDFTLKLERSGIATLEPITSACIGVKDPTDVKVPENGSQQQWKEPAEVIEKDKTYCAILTTDKGRIVMELYPDSAPKNVNSFVFLATNGFYDNITWHRVIPQFVAQTGDPTGTGTGGPGYSVPLEIDPKLKYDRAGRVGVARANDPNSAGSQFFITYAPLPSLDPHSAQLPDSEGYTIIGQVVEGMDVAKAIKPFEADKNPSGKGDPLLTVRIVALDKTSQ